MLTHITTYYFNLLAIALTAITSMDDWGMRFVVGATLGPAVFSCVAFAEWRSGKRGLRFTILLQVLFASVCVVGLSDFIGFEGDDLTAAFAAVWVVPVMACVLFTEGVRRVRAHVAMARA